MLSKQGGRRGGGEVRSTWTNCRQRPQCPYTSCGFAVTRMFSSWISWANDDILLIRSLETNFIETWKTKCCFHSKKMHLKVHVVKYQAICSGVEVWYWCFSPGHGTMRKIECHWLREWSCHGDAWPVLNTSCQWIMPLWKLSQGNKSMLMGNLHSHPFCDRADPYQIRDDYIRIFLTARQSQK